MTAATSCGNIPLWELSGGFSKNNFQVLLNYIAGKTNATILDLDNLADTPSSVDSKYNGFTFTDMLQQTLTHADGLSTAYSEKTSGTRIAVTLDDKDWDAVFLSRSKSGDVVLTLMLDPLQTDWTGGRYNKGITADMFESQYHGIITSQNNSNYSSFYSIISTLNFSTGESVVVGEQTAYSVDYSISYVNSVALNNGGYSRLKVDTDGDGEEDTWQYVLCSKTNLNPFAPFTMESFGLTDYIVKPREVIWQEKQSLTDFGAIFFRTNGDAFNDAWNKEYFANSGANYPAYYVDFDAGEYDWSQSYLWLPSYTEFGGTSASSATASISGIWEINNYYINWLQDYSDGSSISLTSGLAALNVMALRSSTSTYSWIDHNGMTYGRSINTVPKLVLPCMHLNLTAIAESLGLAYGDIYDLVNEQPNYDNLDIMYKYLAGSSTATFYDQITAMANSVSNATTFRENAGGNLRVKFAGFYWDIVYLSKDRNGHVILTLWMANTYQSDFTEGQELYTAEDGAYFGVKNGRLYGATYGQNGYVFADYYGYLEESNMDDWFLENEQMYGYKIITLGMEMLANGEYNLDSYLVKPYAMEWQKEQSAKEILGMPYNLSNESWLTTLSNDGFYLSENNYATYEYSYLWSRQYLWLPSLSEIGYSGTNGLWGVSTEQRACTDDSTGKIGVDEMTIVNNTWTRSANYKQSYGYYFIKSSGDGKGVGASYARVIRPCVHIDLTAMENAR